MMNKLKLKFICFRSFSMHFNALLIFSRVILYRLNSTQYSSNQSYINADNKPGIKSLILFPLQLHRSFNLCNENVMRWFAWPLDDPNYRLKELASFALNSHSHARCSATYEVDFRPKHSSCLVMDRFLY